MTEQRILEAAKVPARKSEEADGPAASAGSWRMQWASGFNPRASLVWA